MVNTKYTRYYRNIFERQTAPPNAKPPRGSVGQDNPTPPSARPASPQPAPSKNTPRPQFRQTKSQRSQKPSRSQSHTVHLTLWVHPRVKAELQRIAELEGISVSAAGAALLEHSLRQSVYTQHAALLDPIIDKAI